MLTSTIKPTWVKSFILGSILLSAFVIQSKAGGIVFEIYLNNKLLLKQSHDKIISGSPDLQLTSANYKDNLRILFSSCGTSSVTRSVGIKNERNILVKKWDFANSTSTDLSMTIPVKEILNLEKEKTTSFKLFYFSPDHFKDGYMLASVLPFKKNVAFNLKNTHQNVPFFATGILAIGILGWILKRKV